MKTGLKAMRVMMAGIPVVAGLCLLQGCSSTKGSTAAPAASVVPETPATQAVVQVETPAVKPETVKAPVEKPKLKAYKPVTTAYSAKAGDTVSTIASKYAVRWQDVLAVNPSLKLNSHLRAGETVQLPGHVDLSKTHAVPAAKKAPAKVAKKAEKKAASE